MAFVSMADVESFKLSSLESKGVFWKEFVKAINTYVKLKVEHEVEKYLHGLSVDIINLDEKEFTIGSGIVEKGDGLYNVVENHIDNVIVEVKRAILAAMKAPEEFKAADEKEMQNIIKNYTDTDKPLIQSLYSVLSLANKLSVNIPLIMRGDINRAKKAIEGSALNVGGKLYSESWFSSYITGRSRGTGVVLKDDEKKLIKTVIEICDILEKDGINSMASLKELNNGAIKNIYCVKFNGGKRAALQSEIKKHVGNLFIVPFEMIEDKLDYYQLELFLMIMTGMTTYKYKLKSAEESDSVKNRKDLLVVMGKNESVESIVGRRYAQLTLNMEMLKAHIKDMLPKLRNGLKEVKYNDKLSFNEEFIIATDYTTMEMVDTIIKEKPRNKYDEIAYKIALSCKNDKKYDLSEKQMDLMTKTYVALRNGNTVSSADAMKVANALKDKYYDQLSPTVKSILDGTVSKQFCSPKQFEVLKKVLEEMDARSSVHGGIIDVNSVAQFDNSGVSTANTGEAGRGQAGVGSTAGSGSVPAPVLGIGGNTDDVDVDDIMGQLFGE